MEVFTHDKKFIGKGYINPKSQIMVRLLTRDKNDEINEQFFFESGFPNAGNTGKNWDILKTAVLFLAKQMHCHN